MSAVAFGLILTGVLLNAIAQLALKASVNEMGALQPSLQVATQLAVQPWLWVGLICYGISVIVWILALSRVDVSIAYPMLSIGYVVNAIAAWQLFGEALGPGRILGMGVIIVGVIILARS